MATRYFVSLLDWSTGRRSKSSTRATSVLTRQGARNTRALFESQNGNPKPIFKVQYTLNWFTVRIPTAPADGKRRRSHSTLGLYLKRGEILETFAHPLPLDCFTADTQTHADCKCTTATHALHRMSRRMGGKTVVILTWKRETKHDSRTNALDHAYPDGISCGNQNVEDCKHLTKRQLKTSTSWLLNGKLAESRLER